MATLREMLKPYTETPARPPVGDPSAAIVRSYLAARTGVGILGVALPVILVAAEPILSNASFSARGSLSAHYHSGVRDVFVAILASVAVLLVSYKLFSRELDNALSSLAGIAAVCVAIFPTGIPTDVMAAPTPFQEWLGADRAEFIHYASAAIFIVCLGVICYYFAVREGNRSQRRADYTARFSPEAWRRFHLLMTALTAAAVVFIVVAELADRFDDRSSTILGGASLASALLAGVCHLRAGKVARGHPRDEERRTRYRLGAMAGTAAVVLLAAGWLLEGLDDYALLIGEWVVVWAFGASWLAKGWEYRQVFGSAR